jgi:hypothetical protein
MRLRYYFRGDRIAPDRDLFLLKAKKKKKKKMSLMQAPAVTVTPILLCHQYQIGLPINRLRFWPGALYSDGNIIKLR